MSAPVGVWIHGLRFMEQSPESAAKYVANLASDEQAKFFNQFAASVNDWGSLPGIQWDYVKDDLTPDAKDVIRELADHLCD